MLNKSCFLQTSLFIFLLAIGVNAATYVVTKTDDTNDGVCNADCSLREAITAANSSPNDDVIDFNVNYFANSAKIFMVTGSEFVIMGNGALTINGDGAALRSHGYPDSVFNINSGANVTLKRLQMFNGSQGGIKNQGTLNLVGCYISSNFGSGIYNNGGNLTITDTTISNNFGIEGGGILNNSGTVSLVNSTICYNIILPSAGTGRRGGGIFNNSGAILNLTNVSLAYNNAGTGGIGNGIYNNGGTVNVRNSIISPDYFGNLNSLGYNLVHNTTNTTIVGDTTGNILNQNPQLTVLGFYGGQTLTLPLLDNSPAINAGNTATSPATDQRGAFRIGTADIGAFELNSSSNGGAYTAVLPTGSQNFTYDFTIIPYSRTFSYLRSSGSLPNGISLNNINDRLFFDGIPTQAGTFNFSITTTNGTGSNVTDYRINVLAPTTVVKVGGRVLMPTGRGLPNAVITMANQYGGIRFARTNPFGYYNFFDVPSNETFNFSVNSKKNYQFVPQNVAVISNLSNINFTPQ
jgi:CSLREA domain-containing protein